MITYSRSLIIDIPNVYKQRSLDKMAALAMESITKKVLNGEFVYEWVVDYYITPNIQTPLLSIEEILAGMKTRFPECSVTHEIRPQFYAAYKHFIIVDWSGS
jgi:hypothetical protein